MFKASTAMLISESIPNLIEQHAIKILSVLCFHVPVVPKKMLRALPAVQTYQVLGRSLLLRHRSKHVVSSSSVCRIVSESAVVIVD